MSLRRVRSGDPSIRVLGGVLALLGLVSVPVRGANPVSDRGGRSSSDVLITTDARVVAGCVSRGAASLSGDDGLELLRREAARRRGADVVRLTALVGRDIRGELYRCGPSPEPSLSVSPTAIGRPSEQVPTSVPESTPQGSIAPSPRAFSPTPTPLPSPALPGSPAARRNASADRQKRAQEELDDLKAAVRLTEDPKLVEGCEKRGEARESREGGAEALRADAVGDLANAVLLRRTDSDLAGEFFRCSSRQLQAIPREAEPKR